MSASILEAIKLLLKGGAALGFIFSGTKAVDLLRKEKTIYESVPVTINQKQVTDLTSDKYTEITFYEEKQMYEENSYFDGVSYLYDHVRESMGYQFFYIVNKDNRNIRVSEKKPKSENKGVYRGWKLNEFTWKSEKWYGYCSPKESKLRGEECKKLPEGWSVKEVEEEK